MKESVGIPDVTGYILERAENILKEAGIRTITLAATSAPVRGQKYSSGPAVTCRVLRQKLLDNDSIELVTGLF
jgi:beta-lactam-binding protein with PASTA domain